MNAWDVFWFLFVFIPLTILWVLTLFDMMGRRDLAGWQKALWAMMIIFFPWIGVFVYLVARPSGAAFPSYAGGPAPETQAQKPQPSPTVTPEQYPTDSRAATS